MPGLSETSSAGRVLVTWPGYAAEGVGRALLDRGLEVSLAPKHGPRSEEELIKIARGCIAVIASTDPFTARVFTALPTLRVVARVGVGLDSIDLDAATECGVAVTIARGTNEAAVADHTIGLMLAALRRIVFHDAAVRAGRWERGGPDGGSDLHGKTVGQIGYGTIGRAVAKRLSGFDVRIIASDPNMTSDGVVEIVALEDLLALADVVSLHLPLSAQTRNVIGEHELSLMKTHAVLVNTSRGGLVDEGALVNQLQAGRLAAAALDVFADEPPKSSGILALPDRTVVTPHVAGLTDGAVALMERHATTAVLRVLDGELPDGIVNPYVSERTGSLGYGL